MKKLVIKKTLSILLPVSLMFSVLFNDYHKAYAVGESMAVELVTTLIGVVISGMANAGLAFKLPEAEKEYCDNNYTSEEYIDVINKANSGETLSDAESVIFLEAAEMTETFYKDVINDMIDSGALDESEETMALKYIYNLFGMDNVTYADVQNALNNYVKYKAAVDDVLNNNLPNFKMIGNAIAFGVDMIKEISRDISKAVRRYVKYEKRRKALSYTYDTYTTVVDPNYNLNLDENCDLVKKILELQSSDSTFDYMCTKQTRNYTGKGEYYYIYYNVKSGQFVASKSSLYSVIRLVFGVLPSTSNQKIYYYEYDVDGNYVEKDYVYSSKVVPGSVIYWSDMTWQSGALGLLGVDSLPKSRLYELESSPTREALPIDDIYADDDTARPTVVPIDNVEGNTVIVNSNTKDDVISGALSGAGAIDGIEGTGERSDAWDDTITGAISNAINDAATETPAEDLDTINKYFSMSDYDSPGLKDLFPFCIPFDLIDLIGVFAADPVTPYIEIPFVFERLGIDEKIVIDFSQFETVAEICRWIERIGFIGVLVIKTRDLIKG